MGYIELGEISQEIASAEIDYLKRYAKNNAWLESLRSAALKGDLPIYNRLTGIKYIPKEYEKILFTKAVDVNAWFNKNGVEYRYSTGETTDTPDQQTDIKADNWQDNPNLTKLQKQHKAILEVIALKQFDPMAIPDGGKGTIQQICENYYRLFFGGITSFETAWKKGRQLFKMANHASFAKRGK